MVGVWREGPKWCWLGAPTVPRDGILKRKTAAWFYQLHNQLSKIKIPENVGDFRLMDRWWWMR